MGGFGTYEFWMHMILLAPPLLLSLTVHEYAHARVALAFGDPTAKLMGRVTLNPLAHLDLIGTICLLFSQVIGWAKPVPVNPANLHPRRLGDIMVSLAGPFSNLVLAVACGVGLRIWWWRGGFPENVEKDSVSVLLLTATIANLGLCLFNLIPLFPLDGHHVVRELLPASRRGDFMSWQVRYGAGMLMALIFVPRILSMATGGRINFDPIGRVLSECRDWVLRILLS
jgi:Zn-dependent protease